MKANVTQQKKMVVRLIIVWLWCIYPGMEKKINCVQYQ